MFRTSVAPSETFRFSWLCVFASMVLLTGCSRSGDGRTDRDDSLEVLRLATTTSTRDSGLLDQMLPRFEQSNGCRVDVVAVGTGAALKLGEAGDADVVLVHAREAEDVFMEAKHGVRHEEIMFNNFVLLGPPTDPASVRDVEPVQALRAIADGEHRFVSRGDDSGTHKREMSLWKRAGVRPAWENYLECGQGMGPALIMASEKRAYVLADMGTFLKFRSKVELAPLAGESEHLRNPYAAIVVRPGTSRINARLADAFVDFLISEEGQQLIGDYQLSGQRLFHPLRIDVSEQGG